MYEDAGQPRIGQNNCELGVRPPGHPVNADVNPDSSGNVAPNGGGMSVFPSILPADLKRIPKRLIPLRLANRIPGAVGDDDMKIWTTGNGAFASSPMTGTLKLNVTSGFHGAICPARSMLLSDFQNELANTRPTWNVEEP